MNILITGVTETHLNYKDRASSTKFVSIPEMMREAYSKLGHHVEHRKVVPADNLRRFDKVFLYAYPIGPNTADVESARLVLDQRHDAYICLDDWSFQRVLPTWSDLISLPSCSSINGLFHYFHGVIRKRWGLTPNC